MWPPRVNLFHDPLNLFQRAGRAINVGRTQPRTEQMFTTENVQRQIAVVLVATIKEATRLMAMQGGIRRIQVQHDSCRGRGVGLEEDVDEELL
jgi:hypothetical protein